MRVVDVKKGLTKHLCLDAAMNKREDSVRGSKLLNGLGEGQVKTLCYLWIHNIGPSSKGLRTANIAAATGYGYTVVNNFYDGLHKRGLISREEIPGQRGHAYNVRLTKRGMEKARKISFYLTELAEHVEIESF